MTVKKSTIEAYRVRNKGEYALICVDAFTGDDKIGGTLMIHSSFGDYGYTWSHCGRDFKSFLCDLRFNYLMGKLMGREATVYDGRATYVRMQQALKEASGTLTPEQVRVATEELESLEDQVLFGRDSVMGLEWPEELAILVRMGCEPYECICMQDNPQAVGLWRDIWPEFVAALQVELVTVPEMRT